MLGSIYALIALGYTMVYGILRIINFAHGDILMVGALTTLSGMHALNAHFPTLPPLAQLGLALLLAMAVCALLAMAVERFAYRRLRNAPRLAPLISGIGVSVLLQTVAMIVWSRNPLMFPQILSMAPSPASRLTASSTTTSTHWRLLPTDWTTRIVTTCSPTVSTGSAAHAARPTSPDSSLQWTVTSTPSATAARPC